MSSSSISLCPGTWLRGVLVAGHRRRVRPSNPDFLHQRRGRSREVTREVVLPLTVDGIQYIMRGGTAWWRLPGGVLVNRDGVSRSSLAKTCATDTPACTSGSLRRRCG